MSTQLIHSKPTLEQTNQAYKAIHEAITSNHAEKVIVLIIDFFINNLEKGITFALLISCKSHPEVFARLCVEAFTKDQLLTKVFTLLIQRLEYSCLTECLKYIPDVKQKTQISLQSFCVDGQKIPYNLLRLLSKCECLVSEENNLITDFSHIGYTEDSYVYSFVTSQGSFILKIVEDDFEKEILNKLLAYTADDINDINNIKFLGYPIKKVGSSWYIFKKYECDLTKIDFNVVSKTPQFSKIGQSLVKGIKILHSLGYTHGDLKPLNICLERGEVRIIDFGSVLPILLREGDTSLSIRNTIMFSSPYQFCKQVEECSYIQYDDAKLILDQCKENFNQCKQLLLCKENKGEDCVMNDLFGCGLLLAYIYGGERNFWTGEKMETLQDTESVKKMITDMIKNVLAFMQDKEKVVDAFIVKSGMPVNDNNTKLMKSLLCSYT